METNLIPSIGNIKYDVREEGDRLKLSHGSHYDLACFALWEGAIEKQETILEDIGKYFTIIANFLVYWTPEHYARNAERLYETQSGLFSAKGYSRKIGRPPFRFILVKDQNPSYTWKQSVSGVIEATNERVVNAKYRYRRLFSEPYQVHSSNNIEEFLVQAALILGRQRLEKTLAETDMVEAVLHKDLEGAAGWEDWDHLFSTINVCCNYLVLRNYESLPDYLADEDVDFLTNNFQRFASAANVTQNANRPFKGRVSVSDTNIPTDIRFTGDKYFATLWQQSVLQKRRALRGMYVPQRDDHFFTLLYHCKVHKKSVSVKHSDVLEKIAREMRFEWFDSSQLHNDEAMAILLKGYFRANNYFYEDPIDLGVGRNRSVIAYLPTEDALYRQNKTSYSDRKIYKIAKALVKRPHKIPRHIIKAFRDCY